MSNDFPVFFPGIVFHELSHVIACGLCGVSVSQVKWFGTDEAYVQHAKPNAWQGLVISIAPFLLGNLIGIALLQSAQNLVSSDVLLSIVLVWLGISLVLYSFPSKQDASNAFSSFTDFYKRHVIDKGSLLTRLVWLLTFPIFFVPVVIILGFILLFDAAFILRILWVIAVVAFSMNGIAL